MSSYAAVTFSTASFKLSSAVTGAYFNFIVTLFFASAASIVNFLPAAVISLSAARVTSPLSAVKSAVRVTASPTVPFTVNSFDSSLNDPVRTFPKSIL